MPSYERYETRRRQTYAAASGRTTWGYWVPLIVTVGFATAGIAAWIWKEREDDDDDADYPPPNSSFHERPPQGYDAPLPPSSLGPQQGGQVPTSGVFGAPTEDVPYSRDMASAEDSGVVSRVSGALRRTPSPQQIFDVASKRVTAGVVAAGAAVGGALASITEESKGGYEDHSRWSEEADSQNGSSRIGPQLRDTEASTTAGSRRKQKTVAIVISADTNHEYGEDVDYHQEHASILSHLPEHVDEGSRVFVLIYDPTLKEHPLSSTEPKTQSMASSFSNIGPEDAQSPGASTPPRSRKFELLYTQAKTLVEKETMIMPFTAPTSYVQMLRQLNPETVYLQANLAGARGEQLDAIQKWVGQIVIVVGDESGHGGLVDSEDERGEVAQEKWWLDDPRIGLGKGIEVVEGLRIGEDWVRRIKGHD